MNRDKLVEIICHDHAIPTGLGMTLINDIVKRIKTALDDEKKGKREIILGRITDGQCDRTFKLWSNCNGLLIYRPDGE